MLADTKLTQCVSWRRHERPDLDLVRQRELGIPPLKTVQSYFVVGDGIAPLRCVDVPPDLYQGTLARLDDVPVDLQRDVDLVGQGKPVRGQVADLTRRDPDITCSGVVSGISEQCAKRRGGESRAGPIVILRQINRLT